MDIPLEVSVELGSVKKSISEILTFGAGTIIELNKLAGENVDIVINNKVIGKGEVIVIDEAYGVRITEVLK
jgi:flagellar motor switch protein FliN/FliY